jgi:4-diphosphocytidyl-2-C-methyl-D-erythritol kinase
MQDFDRMHISNKSCFVRAYAKINVTMEVLGRRNADFHELINIMQTISLYDTICLTLTKDNEISVTCTDPEIPDDSNLVVYAVKLIKEHFSIKKGVLVEIHKHIPIAAGLGGESSDAAAVLIALCRLWQLPVSLTELLGLAASLGSDVAFFLLGGLAVCEGRGEQVRRLPQYWPSSMRWLLLAKPPTGILTADAFRLLEPRHYSDGSYSRAICTSLAQGKPFTPDDLYNSMYNSVREHYPEVERTRDAMLQAGAKTVHLSGTGSALFAPFTRLDSALEVQQKLQHCGLSLYLTHAVYPQNNDFSLSDHLSASEK